MFADIIICVSWCGWCEKPAWSRSVKSPKRLI